MTKVTTDDLAALIRIFDASDWTEMHLKVEGAELFISRDGNAPSPTRAAAPVVPSQAVPISPGKAEAAIPAGRVAIRAPSLGTFYRAPKPGAPAFVELGQTVTADTEICLIEVMKLFTAVRAGLRGTVREVYVQDGDLVEFDQPLFLVEPHA